MAVFVAYLKPEVLAQFKGQYNTQNLIQLKNILTGILLNISKNLGLSVWMDENGTIHHCENDQMLARIKLAEGEMRLN